MARVECSHNIAHCILTPVGDGSLMVHCELGGDVRGQTTIEYDPVAIQGWIRSVCGLTCFNFQDGFAALQCEMEPMLERHHHEEEMRDIRKRFSDGMDLADEERRSWSDQKEHDELRWRTLYTLEEEESTEEYIHIGEYH